MDSQDYNWSWITSSQQVFQGKCELVSVHLVPSGASTGTIVYNGQSSNGKEIIPIENPTRTLTPFIPPVPIYCDQGIYITVGANTTGVLVQWRPAD